MKFSVKGIDAQALLRGALRNKDKIAFVAIMSLALAIAVQIYKRQEVKTEALQEEIAVEEERISVAKELVKQSQDIAKKAAPYFRGKESLDDAALRRLASSNGLKVVSLSLEVGKLAGITEEDLFSLEIKGGYHGLAKFVSLLENRTQLLRIEGLSLKSLVEMEDEEDLSLNLSGRVSYIKAQ